MRNPAVPWYCHTRYCNTIFGTMCTRVRTRVRTRVPFLDFWYVHVYCNTYSSTPLGTRVLPWYSVYYHFWYHGTCTLCTRGWPWYSHIGTTKNSNAQTSCPQNARPAVPKWDYGLVASHGVPVLSRGVVVLLALFYLVKLIRQSRQSAPLRNWLILCSAT